MGDYPDPDEEFELMYADEFDLMRELDGEGNSTSKPTEQPVKSQPEPLSVVDSTDNGRKRTIKELFGDIDDILLQERGDTNMRKKYKKSEIDDKRAADYELIEHILTLRELAKNRDLPDIVQQSHKKSKGRESYNISVTVPNWPFVSVKTHEGDLVYVRCHSEEYEKEEMDRIVRETSKGGPLGGDTVKLWQEAQEIIDKSSEGGEAPYSLDDGDDDSNDLWVNLYKPRKYSELLSDESTNRIMLKWLKLWDKVVFKRRPRIKIAPKAQPQGFNNFNKKTGPDLNTDLDKFGRPHHKVALLCGPPGLGKTTLSHLVARHAGYNVVEVNASDDRNLEFFKNTLKTATQMQSVVDSERRPNCLIFDEIDGAPSSSIDYLVKFVNGDVAGPKKGKGQVGDKGKDSILRRPIICICNDVFTPALRPLRQIAFVINFPPISDTRLGERLMEIARWQHIKTDTGAMLALAKKCNNDIRSCLSVLHLFKAKNKNVNLSDIHGMTMGQKDEQKGIFTIWQDIFTVDPKHCSQIDGPRQRTDKILRVVNSFGEYEKLAQGVFENYPAVQYKSEKLDSTQSALDWFSHSDLFQTVIYSTKNYSLSRYLQYGFVAWHFTFATRLWTKLQYPSRGYEVWTRRNRKMAAVRELLKGMEPGVRCYVQPLSIILDILPLLSVILVPNFRPINLHLYTDKEKSTLKHVVDVMVDYNLNYVQERSAEGNYVYKLDPDFEESSLSGTAANNLSYYHKQLIAKEIVTAKMMKLACEKTSKPPPPTPNNEKPYERRPVIKVKTPPSKDFFGRLIARKTDSSTGSANHGTSNDIWYQYKEGYSNAVRKKIIVSSLR